MRREHLAVIAAALTVACVLPYLRDIRRGTTRPQRASWFVFATLAAVAAISQGLGDGGPGTWLAAGSALGFGAVFVASIPRGVGGFGAADRVALAIAAAGTTASLLVGRPIFALLGVVIAELSAVGLTAKKALADPRSETGSTWIIDGLAGLLSIVAVDHVTTTNLLYPVHHTVANGAVVVAMAIGHRRSPGTAPAHERTGHTHLVRRSFSRRRRSGAMCPVATGRSGRHRADRRRRSRDTHRWWGGSTS